MVTKEILGHIFSDRKLWSTPVEYWLNLNKDEKLSALKFLDSHLKLQANGKEYRTHPLPDSSYVIDLETKFKKRFSRQWIFATRKELGEKHAIVDAKSVVRLLQSGFLEKKKDEVALEQEKDHNSS